MMREWARWRQPGPRPNLRFSYPEDDIFDPLPYRVPDLSEPRAVVITSSDPHFRDTRLKCSSVIRTDKLATIDRTLIIGELGVLPLHIRELVNQSLVRMLEL